MIIDYWLLVYTYLIIFSRKTISVKHHRCYQCCQVSMLPNLVLHINLLTLETDSTYKWLTGWSTAILPKHEKPLESQRSYVNLRLHAGSWMKFHVERKTIQYFAWRITIRALGDAKKEKNNIKQRGRMHEPTHTPVQSRYQLRDWKPHAELTALQISSELAIPFPQKEGVCCWLNIHFISLEFDLGQSEHASTWLKLLPSKQHRGSLDHERGNRRRELLHRVFLSSST